MVILLLVASTSFLVFYLIKARQVTETKVKSGEGKTSEFDSFKLPDNSLVTEGYLKMMGIQMAAVVGRITSVNIANNKILTQMRFGKDKPEVNVVVAYNPDLYLQKNNDFYPISDDMTLVDRNSREIDKEISGLKNKTVHVQIITDMSDIDESKLVSKGLQTVQELKKYLECNKKFVQWTQSGSGVLECELFVNAIYVPGH